MLQTDNTHFKIMVFFLLKEPAYEKLPSKNSWTIAKSKNFLFDEPGSALLLGEELKFLPQLAMNFGNFSSAGEFSFA